MISTRTTYPLPCGSLLTAGHASSPTVRHLDIAAFLTLAYDLMCSAPCNAIQRRRPTPTASATRLLFVLVLCGARCGPFRPDPCPDDNVVHGTLAVDRNELFVGDKSYGQADAIPAKCTEITGDLSITGDVNSLAFLDRVTKISGGIWLDGIGAAGVRDISSLNELTYLGGLLECGRSSLTDISGFNKLQQMYGLWIQGCTSSVTGFTSLREVERFWYSGSADLRGFRSLERVGASGLLLQHVEGPELTGLRSLKEVDGPVEVSGESVLPIVSFPALRTVSGRLTVFNIFMNVLELPALESVGGNLLLGRLYYITSLDKVGQRSGLGLNVGNDLKIRDIMNLPQDVASAWAARVSVVGTTLVCGNKDGPACP